MTLELGGKSANVVFADADVEGRPRPPRRRVFDNAGQDCCARSRILVERSALDALPRGAREAVEAIARRRSARRGDRDGPAGLGGPARDGRLVRARRRAGGDPRHGARRARLLVPATVLYPVEPRRPRGARGDLRAGRRRVPFDDEAEAVALANDTIYGLSGSIWTRDGAKALRVARAVEAGMLSINSNTSVRVSTPFGGFKQSGVRARARPARARALHRDQDRLLRDGR